MIFPSLEGYQQNDPDTQKKVRYLIDQLRDETIIGEADFLFILDHLTFDDLQYLSTQADKVRKSYYGDAVYMRGLIEFSNYCSRGCNYCGIRAHNNHIARYRLDSSTIMASVDMGYDLGYRTFVLQAGEDAHYTDEVLIDILKKIKSKYPEVAITLSVGERSKESYKALYDAGCDRYLLRHETASKRLYEVLHPNNMSFENRIQCLWDLKEIGYQVGAGFMVNTPTQTNQDLVKDFMFLHELEPHMVGIGPYISHSETPLGGNKDGTLNQTIACVALTRLVLPKALLPSTTALGTIYPRGREKAIKAGANVVMPNISPKEHRDKYELYENKICTGDTASHCRTCIEGRVVVSGYSIDMSRGDYIDLQKKGQS